MRGRKPKPTSLQIAEGDPRKRGKNKLEEKLSTEPEPRKGLPSCPMHLIGRAQEAWEFFAAELGEMNIDHKPDAVMLEGVCVNYARAVLADAMIQGQGLTVEESVIDEESGEKIVLKIKAHPAIAISNKAWQLVKSFCCEFGLSPASRTRLTIEPKSKPGDDLAALLAAPRSSRSVVIQ